MNFKMQAGSTNVNRPIAPSQFKEIAPSPRSQAGISDMWNIFVGSGKNIANIMELQAQKSMLGRVNKSVFQVSRSFNQLSNAVDFASSISHGTDLVGNEVGNFQRAMLLLGTGVPVPGNTIASKLGVRLIGVPDVALSKTVARLINLQGKGKNIIFGVKAYGSRAGSKYRGRGPLPDSDLDLMIDINAQFIDDPRTRNILKQIAIDFEKETGIKLSIHSKHVILNNFSNETPPNLIDLRWKQ